MISRRDRIFWVGLCLPLLLLSGYFALLMGVQAQFFDLKELTGGLFSKDLFFAVRLSLLTATLSALLALAVAVPAAYVLSRTSFPGKRLLDTFLDIPVVLTPIALGTLILMVFNTELGRLLEAWGLSVPYTVAGVVLAQFTVIVAMAVRMLKATFDEISPRYEQVARLLGCSATGAFFRISLPMARKGMLAAFVLTWARAVGEFGATVMVAGTAKGKTATLPTSIYLAMSSANLGRAVILISLLIVLAFVVLLAVRLLAGRAS